MHKSTKQKNYPSSWRPKTRTMLEEGITRVWPPVDPRAGHGQLEAAHPYPCSWNVHFCPPFLQWELFQRRSPEGARCSWDRLDDTCDWTSLRPLHKLLRFWWASVEIYLSCGYPRPELPTFLCLLKLLRTHLERSGSFSGLSLPSV